MTTLFDVLVRRATRLADSWAPSTFTNSGSGHRTIKSKTNNNGRHCVFWDKMRTIKAEKELNRFWQLYISVSELSTVLDVENNKEDKHERSSLYYFQ
jgi:hypothetical protein